MYQQVSVVSMRPRAKFAKITIPKLSPQTYIIVLWFQMYYASFMVLPWSKILSQFLTV